MQEHCSMGFSGPGFTGSDWACRIYKQFSWSKIQRSTQALASLSSSAQLLMALIFLLSTSGKSTFLTPKLDVRRGELDDMVLVDKSHPSV